MRHSFDEIRNTHIYEFYNSSEIFVMRSDFKLVIKFAGYINFALIHMSDTINVERRKLLIIAIVIIIIIAIIIR